MGEQETTQPGTLISKALWEQFRKDVEDRHGVVRGHLKHELENAIKEYINASEGGDTHDRLRRIENRLDDVADVVESERKKKKDSDVSETVKNRLGQIETQIQREIGDADKAHVSVVNKAIEDNAGSSRPTLDRYKEMLEQRHIGHEWPSEDSDTWWFDNEQFVEVVNSKFDYHTLSARYGEEWYDQMLNKVVDDDGDTPTGFQ